MIPHKAGSIDPLFPARIAGCQQGVYKSAPKCDALLIAMWHRAWYRGFIEYRYRLWTGATKRHDEAIKPNHSNARYKRDCRTPPLAGNGRECIDRGGDSG